MIDFGNFYSLIAKNHLSHWLETLPAQIANWQREQQHGLFKQWSNAVEFLPEIKPYRLDLLHSVTAESEEPLSAGQIKRIETLMRNLMPWRKGPFSLYGVNIDTEWRSDWKWDRVMPHLSDLTGRTILDVGCGSGYHMWRMIGAGAHLAVGIDPTQLFLCLQDHADDGYPVIPAGNTQAGDNQTGLKVEFFIYRCHGIRIADDAADDSQTVFHKVRCLPDWVLRQPS